MNTQISIGKNDIAIDIEKSAFATLLEARQSRARIGIACSGGADSVFLTLAIAHFWKGMEDRLYILHFNHKARKNAEIDEEFVRKLAEKIGVECIVGAPRKKPEKLTEDEFRKMRLEFFSAEFFQKKLDLIAEGHHAGDVAESLLMRLMRGSALDGLCAPRPVSEVGGVRFVRPMLKVKKDFMRRALADAGLDWREDESNAEGKFLRNRIRNSLLPEIAKISPADFALSAGRTRAILQEDADFIDAALRSELAAANPVDENELFIGALDFRKRPSGSAVLINEPKNRSGTNVNRIAVTEKILHSRPLLRRSLMLLLARAALLDSMRSEAVEDFLERIEGTGKNPVRSSAGKSFVCFEPRDMSFSIVPSAPADSFEIPLLIGKNRLPTGILTVKRIGINSRRLQEIKDGGNDDSVRAYLDLSAAGTFEDGALCARSPRAGDSYPPLGSHSKKKLKEIFNAKKIPSMKRKRIPLVCNKKGEIVWGPNLPPSDIYKLVNTSAAIELTFESF